MISFFEMLNNIFLPLISFAIIFLILKTTILHPLVNKGINAAMMIIVTIFSVRLLNNIIVYSFDAYWATRGKETTLERSLKSILKVIKVIVWGIGLVFLLDNLGFKISAVIAGLGISGVVMTLA
jgi:small-conductance mechanosensitive channel